MKSPEIEEKLRGEKLTPTDISGAIHIRSTLETPQVLCETGPRNQGSFSRETKCEDLQHEDEEGGTRKTRTERSASSKQTPAAMKTDLTEKWSQKRRNLPRWEEKPKDGKTRTRERRIRQEHEGDEERAPKGRRFQEPNYRVQSMIYPGILCLSVELEGSILVIGLILYYYRINGMTLWQAI